MYLEVFLDSRFSRTPHIKFITGKALRAVSVLRALSPLFQSDGGIVFRIFERVQYEALRAMLGCIRSTRIATLLS